MNLFEKAVNGDEFLFRQLLSFEKLLKEGKVSRLLLIEKASEKAGHKISVPFNPVSFNIL